VAVDIGYGGAFYAIVDDRQLGVDVSSSPTADIIDAASAVSGSYASSVVFSSSACILLNEIGKRISVNTGESRETRFLFQRASVLVQRFNAILLHDTLPAADCKD